jgi:hypothetical protein
MPLGDLRPKSADGDSVTLTVLSAYKDESIGNPVGNSTSPSIETKSVNPGADNLNPPEAERKLRADILERIDRSHLTDTQFEVVTTLLQKYEGAFVDEQGSVGTTSCAFHKIDTGNAEPIKHHHIKEA